MSEKTLKDISNTKGFAFYKMMDGMMEMGGADYARQEAWGIQNAASVLSQLAYMCIDEVDEPSDIKELTAIMRSLMTFIEGELSEMEKATRRGENYEKNKSVETVPAQVKDNTYIGNVNLDLRYVKSLGVDLPEKKLAVKYVGKNTIAHPVFIWGDESKTDLDVEFFKRDSNFWDDSLKDFQRPLTWDHGQDERFNKFENYPVIGKTVNYHDDDIARWAESVIDTDKQYRKFIDQFIEEKRLGYSSDSLPQYIIREPQGKAIWLKSWPWFGGALTASPCEPRMKMFTPEFIKSLGITLPDVNESHSRYEILKRQLEFLKLKTKVG